MPLTMTRTCETPFSRATWAALVPAVCAAKAVLRLAPLKPTEPAVVTVGSIRAGTTFNIIGDRCDLQMTVRSYSDEVRTQLLAAIERKAKGIALAAADAGRPEFDAARGTLLEIADEHIKVYPVLAGLRLRNLLEGHGSGAIGHLHCHPFG